MNQREYERAIRDTRKGIYQGDAKAIIGGIVRALVAKADPGVNLQASALPGARKRVLGPAGNREKRLYGR